MTAKVNLDALIPREDFDIADNGQNTGTRKDTISINDLKKNEFFYSALRKPDFQRETNEWSSKKICELIESFLDGDLIPAIILWKSASSDIFIIDGSHRISAISAWINNDYGDGDISKLFYDGVIPEDQIEIAQRTRKLLNKRVGPYKDHELALEHPEKVKPEIVTRAKRLGALAIQLQWVQGDSAKAESSFFKINQQASPINITEFRVLQARKSPNGISARAIIRSGRGHKYWSVFSEDNQNAVEEISREINQLLFNPELDNPIKTLDLPIGGKVYAAQSLSLVLDFINIVNGVPLNIDHYPPDVDGSKTIEYLANCRRVVQRINSINPCSLGLHPIIYFYSMNGQYKIASFYAITAMIMDFEKRNFFSNFTSVRKDFEDLLFKNDYLIQQIVRKYRGATDSYPHIKNFYLEILNELLQGNSIDKSTANVMASSSFNYLIKAPEDDNIYSPEFSRETKSAAFIREAIKNPLRCEICGGIIHKNSITIDHKVRKREGGLGSLDNAQLAHPYCNTTYKQ